MRASTSFPKKTALGVEEMRQRTHGLSQRHRTMLLLVNGKRERAEVLTLAGQAGVGPAVLDELVAIGLVDDGRATPPEPVREPVPVAPRGPAVAPPEAVREPVPVAPPAAVPARARKPAPAAKPAAPPEPQAAATPVAPPSPEPGARSEPEAAAAAEPVPASQPDPELEAAPLPSQPAAPQPAPAPAQTARVRVTPSVQRPKPPARAAAPVEVRRFDRYPELTAAKPPARRSPPPMPPPASADDSAEQRLLAEARTLLIGSLLVDGPVSSSLTALRVRKARTRDELAALVWDIERRLIVARRPPEAQARLKRARDLLGLGNTVVEGEDEPDDGDTVS